MHMRFATYLSYGHPRPAVVGDDDIIDLELACQILQAEHLIPSGAAPQSLLALIRLEQAGIDLVEAVLAHRAYLARACRPIASVRFAAPIPHPPHVYCVASNYIPLKAEQVRLQRSPAFYSKDPNTVIGPGDAIRLHPELTDEVDYEAELAVVIGRKVSNVGPDQAARAVFGYTCLNDVTARDVMRRPKKWLLGKNLDTFCPTGPVVVHCSELPWPPSCGVIARVNGEIRQFAEIADLVFDIPTLISYLSVSQPLEWGDIVATGTPFGVGADLRPPRFLRPGDRVEVEVTGVGRLANPCV